MSSHKRIHWLWFAGIAVLALDVMLLWSVRTLPAVYGSWISVARVIGGLIAKEPAYVEAYALVNGPVPNSAFAVLLALLGPLVTFEGAVKLMLSAIVVLFPLGVLTANRALHGGGGETLALLTVPLAMAWQSLVSQSCMIGLTLVVWGLAYYGWRSGRFRSRDIATVAGLLVLIFFVHGLSFIVAVVVCVSFVLREPISSRNKILMLGLLVAPSMALAVWYMLGHHPVLTDAGSWSIYAVLQSAFKPLMLFMRVSGVASPIPPTYGNLPWLVVCGALLLMSARRALTQRNLDLRFVVPAVFCLCCVLLLPDPLLGIDQPGTRFMIPLIVFLILLLGRVRIEAPWGVALVSIALAAVLYNLFWFVRFDEKATKLAQDLDDVTQGHKAAYVLALDWPRATAFSDRISAYAGGLSGIPQLYNVRKNLIAEIPETGPVIMSPALRARFPVPTGTDLASWTSSILASYPLFENFSHILVVGTNDQSKRSIASLLDHNWQVAVHGEAWTILRSPLLPVGTQ